MRRRQLLSGLGGVALSLYGSRVREAEKLFRVGYLDPASKAPISEGNFDEFRKALIGLGYEDGRNVAFEVRWANGNPSLYASLCAELAAARIDVLVTHSTWGASIAKRQVSAIPIVLALVQDAVGNGLVQSLAHPGENITGSSFFFPELMLKRLSLALEALPNASRVATLVFPDDPAAQLTVDSLRAAAQTKQVTLDRFDARGPEDFDKVSSDIAANGSHVVIVPEQAMFGTHARALASALLAHSLPSVGWASYASVYGDFIGYGPRISTLFQRAAWYVDKILHGVAPRDLPVEQPTEFLLTINTTVAKSLRVTVPPMLLARADNVIE